MQHGALAFEEILQVDHREQVAAQVANAQQPRLCAGYRRGGWQRHDFHHVGESRDQVALANAVADATPLVLGDFALRQDHRVCKAAALVFGQDVERSAVHGATRQLPTWVRIASSNSSRVNGLVRYCSEPTMRPRALSNRPSLEDSMITGVCLNTWLFLISAQVW